MSLMLWAPIVWSGSALAGDGGSAVWLGLEPDPTLLPQATTVTVEELSPNQAISDADRAAVDALRAELEAVGPLIDEFDGELAIMSRLDSAVSEVHVLSSDEDRALLYDALVFQGFAVHRYFQDQLATDPAAAPYRIDLNGTVTVKAWVDAVALDPDRDPSEGMLPEDSEAVAFDEARAAIRLAPRASVFGEVPDGASIAVDGWPAVPGGRAKVAPGYHRVAVVYEEKVVARAEGRVMSGEDLDVVVGAMADDVLALQAPLSEGPDAYAIPPAVGTLLASVDAPVHLVVPGDRKGAFVYIVDGQAATRLIEEAEPADERLVLRVGAGGGWMYDGGWYVDNYFDGAPGERATVNAVTPVLSAGFELRPRRLVAVGAGADLAIPTGTYSTLPSGETAIRLRAHPHVAVGLPWLQATAGYLFPWHAAFGARAHVPVGERLELTAAGLYGLGLSFEQDGNPDNFQAQDAFQAWVGVGGAFGRY